MSVDINSFKLAKTPFWAIDLSRILNRYLSEDGRIPEGSIRFFVSELDDRKVHVTIEKVELTLDKNIYQDYCAIACEIFSTIKEEAIAELDTLQPTKAE